MAAKVILALCASALIVNMTSAQCAGNGANNGVNEVTNFGVSGNGLSSGCGSSNLGVGVNGLGLGANGLGFGANGLGLGANNIGFGANCLGLGANGPMPGNLALSSGGAFTVSSASPIAPSGLSIVSENALDGPVAVSGGLPFLSAVGVEGQVPASGASGVSYNCGNGNIGIVSENVAPAANVGIGAGLGAGLGVGQGVGLGAGRFGFGSPLAGRGFGANFGGIGARGCGAASY